MTTAVYHIIAMVLVVGFLGGIRLMRSPRTAAQGNLLGAACMLGAVVLTLVKHGVVGTGLLWAAMATGAAIGTVIALRVTMVQMPQLVALLNGFGGAASAIVAVVVLNGDAGDLNLFNRLSGGLALVVGTVTLSGSLVAAGKLAGRLRQRPVALRAHGWVTGLAAAATAGLAVAVAFMAGDARPAISIAALVAASLYGVVMTIRIGGADMPITISLLNSWSGVAAAIAGFAIGSPLLVATGGIVGAAGLILTQTMCRAMNRSLMEVLSGRTTVASGSGAATEPSSVDPQAASRVPGSEPPAKEGGEHAQRERADLGTVLRAAKTVVIVPGYGMALAQAQQQVKQLMDTLEAGGAEVNFAIHPVAGRMPGHMNVLLAEVDVPYDTLWELDAANAALAATDLAIVIGANDVVNPAAMTAEGTPIYGMPVLRVADAGKVIICNMDTAPGYAGVPNPLYENAGVTVLLGDAKETVPQLTSLLSD